eukprot:CAMPEP_0185834670 /NCGR_PEP_ID=MMETSP1353-20130828/5917_1 /TAXON_ID=1077150 /ORGANISM="Erythrolobus australicus, Strain CCMP3124" /LENGTH=64 /DNA_ID=CAMNT_0028533149 /DNA_START=290 /DNA_END=484 /DNA_ORIENTATION=-
MAEQAANVSMDLVEKNLSCKWASERTGRCRHVDNIFAAKRRMRITRKARTPRKAQKSTLCTQLK